MPDIPQDNPEVSDFKNELRKFEFLPALEDLYTTQQFFQDLNNLLNSSYDQKELVLVITGLKFLDAQFNSPNASKFLLESVEKILEVLPAENELRGELIDMKELLINRAETIKSRLRYHYIKNNPNSEIPKELLPRDGFNSSKQRITFKDEDEVDFVEEEPKPKKEKKPKTSKTVAKTNESLEPIPIIKEEPPQPISNGKDKPKPDEIDFKKLNLRVNPNEGIPIGEIVNTQYVLRELIDKSSYNPETNIILVLKFFMHCTVTGGFSPTELDKLGDYLGMHGNNLIDFIKKARELGNS